jgi:hypothetical protein
MKTAELLVPRLVGRSAEEVIAYYESVAFGNSEDYKNICNRILPDIQADEIRPLFYSVAQQGALVDLQKNGFVREDGKILSQLLLEAFMICRRNDQAGGRCQRYS